MNEETAKTEDSAESLARTKRDFKQLLLEMPNVGEDEDFNARETRSDGNNITER